MFWELGGSWVVIEDGGLRMGDRIWTYIITYIIHIHVHIPYTYIIININTYNHIT